MPTIAPVASASSAPAGSTPAPVQTAPAAAPVAPVASPSNNGAPIVVPAAGSGAAVGAVSPTSSVPGAPAGTSALPAAANPAPAAAAKPITPEDKIAQPNSGVPSAAPAKQSASAPAAQAAPVMDKDTQIAYQNRIKQLQDSGVDIKTAQAQANADLVKAGQSARPYEIWSNLAEGQKNTPNAFKDRATFNTAYGYDQKNAQEKAVMDSFWNATAPKTTADLLVKLANGETLGNTPQEQNATRYFSMLNQLSQKGPDALKGAVDMGLVSPGSQAWNILAAKNPQLTAQYEQASKNEQILSNINQNSRSNYESSTAASAGSKSSVKSVSSSVKKSATAAPATADDHVAKAGENITSALVKQNPELTESTTFNQLSSSLMADPAVQNIQSQMRDAFNKKATLQADIRTLESDVRNDLKKHGVEGPVADAYVAAKTQTLNLQLQPLLENMNFLQSQLSYITDNHWKEVQTNMQQQGLDLQKNQQDFNQKMALKNYQLDTAKYETSIQQFNATQKQQVQLAKMGYDQQEKMAAINTQNQGTLSILQAQLDKQKINPEIISDPMTGRKYVVNKNTGEQIGKNLFDGYGNMSPELLKFSTLVQQKTNDKMDDAMGFAARWLVSGMTVDQWLSNNKTPSQQATFKSSLAAITKLSDVHNATTKNVETGLLTVAPSIQKALEEGKTTVYAPNYKALTDELAKALAGGASSEASREEISKAGFSDFDALAQRVKQVKSSDNVPLNVIIDMAKLGKAYLEANVEVYNSKVQANMDTVDNDYDLQELRQRAGSDYVNRNKDMGDVAGTLSQIGLGKKLNIPQDIIARHGEQSIEFVPAQVKQEVYLLNNEAAAKNYAAHPKTFIHNESVFREIISNGTDKVQVAKAMRKADMYDTYAYLLWY